MIVYDSLEISKYFEIGPWIQEGEGQASKTPEPVSEVWRMLLQGS